MKRLFIFFVLILKSSYCFAQDLDKFKYFFVTPTNVLSDSNALFININSDYFSNDTFSKYFNLIDSVCRLKLSNGTLKTKTEIEEFEHRLGLNLFYYGYYLSKKKWDSYGSIKIYLEAIEHFKLARNTKDQAMPLNAIANEYEALGDITSAINYYKHALAILEETGNKREMPITLDDLGMLYLSFQDVENAEKYFVKSIETCRERESYFHAPYSLMNLATVYSLKGRFEESKELLREALKIAVDSINVFQQSKIHYTWGCVLELEEKFEEALEKFIIADNLAIKINYKNGIAKSSLKISKLYYKNKLLDKALTFALKSMKVSKETMIIKNIKEAAEWLSELYAKMNQSDIALEYYKLTSQMKDSLFNSKNQKVIIRQQIQYEYDKKEALSNLEIKQQKQQKYFYIIIGILLLFALVGFINRLYYTRKANAEIEKQKNRAEKLEQFKSRLYANITHEFRTPLTLILGMAEQLEKKGAEMIQESSSLIINQGNLLLNLINQLLDLSKLESNTMTVQYLQGDIIGFVKSLVLNLQRLADHKDIKIEFDNEPLIIVMDFDEEKIRQIVSNLLSNSIKFTPIGGIINVQIKKEICSLDTDNGNAMAQENVLFQIKDNGIGISKEQLPFIFNRFFQVDNNMTRSGQGTGIGLSLVQELVKLLSGTIDVSSEPSYGTSFVIRLPIYNHSPMMSYNEILFQESNPTVPRIDHSKRNLSEHEISEELPNILIIEDNQDIRNYIQTILVEDYNVELALNGADGIDKALNLIPDLIICDIMMPLKDGYEVCDMLKNDSKSSHIPIILLTAKSTIDDRIDGLRRKADAYISKPFRQEELLIQIFNLIEGRKVLQDHYINIQSEKDISKEEQIAFEDAFIIKLRQGILDNLINTDLSIDGLCKHMVMSRMQLHRKLKALTGLSTSIYIRNIRLTKAKELLKSSNLNVSEVAYAVGFDDPKYFSRVYKEEFGQAPREDRS